MDRTKRRMRQRLLNWWSDYSWLVLLLVGLAGLTLGYLGFSLHASQLGLKRSFLDNLYLTLGLLSLNSGSVEGPVPWQLQVARFLVPAVAAYTALLALAAVFARETDRLKLWFARDHVIICGLGKKGIRLANQFRGKGFPVVVIEADETNDWIENIRSAGAIVIQGDATDPVLLQKARLNRARYLFAVLADDGENAEIAVQAERLTQLRNFGSLTCFLHIFDSQLWHLLREKEFDPQKDSRFRLELFNIFHHGAQLMLGIGTPWNRTPGKKDYQALLVGLGKMGQSLAVEIAQKWRSSPSSEDGKLQLTIVDLDAEHKLHILETRYPLLGSTVTLKPLSMDINSAAFQGLADSFIKNGLCSLDSVYICLDDESLSLHTALTLNRKLREYQIPITLRMAESGGLSKLLRGANEAPGSFTQLEVFDLLDQTCTYELLLNGTHEILARNLHQAYLEGLPRSQGESVRKDIWRSWEELSPQTQEKNRRQADRIPLVLAAAGYRIDPLTDWEAAQFRFSEGAAGTIDEVALMAPVEHELWCQDLRQDGYQRGKERDDHKKTHPNLVPWEELIANAPDEAEKNMTYIRDLPKVLAQAGFQIEKIPQKGPAAADR